MKREAVKGVIALVIIVGGLLGVKYAFSPKEGQRCKDSSWGCAWGLKCVDSAHGHHCRKMCKSDHDCEQPKHCKSLMVFGGGADDDERACL